MDLEPDDDPDDEPPDPVDLGPCCVCETPTGACNILMLHLKAPIPGRGWGCVVCDLPSDGALVVLCDACMGQPVKFVCRGYPASDGRVPFGEVTGAHEHDLMKHPLSDLEEAAIHPSDKRVASGIESPASPQRGKASA